MQINHVLNSGGVLLHLSDTIWGLAANALNPDAVKKIYRIKNRELSKPLIVLLNEYMLADFVDEQAAALIREHIGTTFVCESKTTSARHLLSESGEIALRIPKSEQLRQLLTQLNFPLVSTSANFSGKHYPKCFADIDPELIALVDLVQPSTNESKDVSPSPIFRVLADGNLETLRK